MLPLGLVFLVIGILGLRNYFRLKGPPLSDLHEVRLLNVTNVVAESEIPSSKRIDNIWLWTSTGAKIRYRSRFPYSSEVQHLDPHYGLLLDRFNIVWAVTTSRGEVLKRNYFDEYNIEAKSVGKFCGGFMVIGAVCAFFVFFYNERRLRAGTLPAEEMMPIRTRQLILIGSLVGYLVFCVAVVFPLLSGKLPGWVLMLIWVLGGGLLGNGIVSYFRKHPPRS